MLEIQTADWKTEKHVPVIELVSQEAEKIHVRISIGKQIAHPNTIEHHIEYIQVFFKAEGEKFPWQLGNFSFTAHGASVAGADQSTVYTNYEITFSFNTQKKGKLIAIAYCNIHGLWQSEYEI